MDESHRLKPMPAGYDQALFNQLFKETELLRKKLAWDIDSRKFGIDYEDMVSAFDIKFIYAFNKYYGHKLLKGYIISSLQMYKQRIIKNSYLDKAKIHQSVDITELYNYDNLLFEEPELLRDENRLLTAAKKYLKDRLSDNAYLIFDLELNPPPYILTKLQNPEQKKIPKCPAKLIAEYLGINDEPGAIEFIEDLRKEINQMIKQAREYYSMPESAISLS